MEKQIVKDQIFCKAFDGDLRVIRRSDFPDEILPNDIIDIVRDEGYYSENNSWDANTTIYVFREREETDDEFEERLGFYAEKKEEMKKRRYENYLELKKEFENEG